MIRILTAVLLVTLIGCVDDITLSEKKYRKAVEALDKGDQERALTLLRASLEKNSSNEEANLLFSRELLKKNRTSYRESGTIEFDELFSRTWRGSESSEALRQEIIDFLLQVSGDSLTTSADMERLFEIQKRCCDSLSGSWLDAATLYEILRNPALVKLDTPEELRLLTEYSRNAIDSLFSLRFSNDHPLFDNIISLAISSAALYRESEQFDEVKRGYFKYTMQLNGIISAAKRMGSVPRFSSESKAVFLRTVMDGEYTDFVNRHGDQISPFQFVLPEGWKDYTAVVKKRDNNIPETLRSYTGYRKMLKIYADPRTVNSGNGSVMTATWSPGVVEIDREFLDSYSSDVLEKFERDSISCELLEKDLIEREGFTVAKFTYGFENGDRRITSIVSGNPFSVIYSLDATKAQLAKREDLAAMENFIKVNRLR